jgi:phosphoribosylformylglycinamidine cyclo-ligase
MSTHDYKSAGVDISAGNEAVERIKPLVRKTHSAAVLGGLGGFGSLFDLSDIIREMKQPILVQSIDGVGTKVSLAVKAGAWESIGYDVVSAVCNDILVTGARSLTFLDYIANDKLNPEIVARLVAGMAENCAAHGVALVGGETAEMPGVYRTGEHDVVGCGLGIVDRADLVTGNDVKAGDRLLGLKSSGPHTNGYSLVRKLTFEVAGLQLDSPLPTDPAVSVGEALLARHINYQPAVRCLQQSGLRLGAMAHITGGGLIENLPRVFPDSLDAAVDLGSWETPALFRFLRETGALPPEEAYRTFNMGIGFVFILNPEIYDTVRNLLEGLEPGSTVELGEMQPGTGEVQLQGTAQ